MSFINNICDKVYVINLKKDTQKMKSAKSQLDNEGIQFERFDAIYGKDISNNSFFTQSCYNYCTNGIKGCAASHRNLWETMIKNNYDHIMILEDDFIISKDFNTKFALLYNDVPKDFDILYLGSTFYCNDTSYYSQLFNYIRNNKKTAINKNIIQSSGCGGLFAYIISNKCAKQFLNEKVSFHIDDNIIDWIQKHNLKSYYIEPSLITCSLEDSNISSNYPYILNKAISNIHPTTKWLINESGFTVLGLNINLLLFLLISVALFIPLKYYYFIYLWIFAEFLVSKDAPNSLRYSIVFAFIFIIKYILHFY